MERTGNPNSEMIASLRDVANLLESHPELPKLDFAQELSFAFFGDNARSDLRRVAKCLGGATKNFFGDYFSLKHRFGLLTLEFWCERHHVCRRVVHKRTVEATPELVIPAEPERVIEEVEWVCEEPLLMERSQA